jgi:geranylgeranyl diphosphate synthase type II
VSRDISLTKLKKNQWQKISSQFELSFQKNILCFNGNESSAQIKEAIHYCLFPGGKRIRPSLCLAASIQCRNNISTEQAIDHGMSAAMALEMIHSYTLVHDDLPAMDNDDWRRGKPSCHKKFGEAVAILVGDALLTDAFLCLSKTKLNLEKQLQELTNAAGSQGLIAGQLRDLSPNKKGFQEKDWIFINDLKTGKLFEASLVMGGLSVGATKNELAALRKFGFYFGRAFQLRDDLDDQAFLFHSWGEQKLINEIEKNAHQAVKLFGGESSDSILVEICAKYFFNF